MNTLRQVLDGSCVNSAVYRAFTPQQRRLLQAQLLRLVVLEANEVELSEAMSARTLTLPQQQQQQQQQQAQHVLVPVLQCFPEDFSPAFLRASSSAVERLSVSLMPEERFYLLRSDLASKLQHMLDDGLPRHTAQIKTFGSSRNCFGSKSSDVDMCLLLTLKEGQSGEEEDTAEVLIEQLVSW